MTTDIRTSNTLVKPIIMLVDNGSTRVDAAVQLRQIAANLSDETGQTIHAVSMQHSNRIPEVDVTQKLSDIPAQVFREFMTQQLSKGEREFILIPLFFGKSRALTSFVPDEMDFLEEEFGPIKLIMADVLYPLPEGEPLLIEILLQHATLSIKKGLNENTNDLGALKNLVLVDHGSPLAAVTAVREHIATALNAKLPETITLKQAAMERRKGKEYDFNGELLEDYLSKLATAGETQATVLLLFLLPGTHAGENGDIVQICNKVMQQYPDFNVSISPLIGQNKTLVTCLAQRLNQLINT